jgi:tight adherence protein C
VAERTDVDELQSFVMALVQAEAFGIAISQVLRAQAAELRLRRHQRAEELAQKAPVKQVFPLILCILPATIFIVIGPAVVLIGRMFGFVSGR